MVTHAPLLLAAVDTAQAAQDASAPGQSCLSWIDWGIVVIYVAVVLGFGWYVSRKQEGTEDYFVGGRHMHPLLIGISMYATMLSTITYLGFPGEIIRHGPIILAGLFAIPIVYFLVAYWLLPVYMKQRVTSAYELLEAKVGLTGRLVGASMFIVLRLVWMALLTYMASWAIAVMIGVDTKWTPLIAAGTGTVAIIYTSMGGLRAVVITDVVQFFLFFGGAALTVLVITWRMGGFGWWPTQWASNWDTQPFASLDPTIRVTVMGGIITQILIRVATLGGDQTMVQRFMATENVAAARQAFLIKVIVNIAVLGVLGLLGFALLGYFTANPQLLPQGVSVSSQTDRIFPLFIAHHLPTGIAGLLISALFAAGMSSVDSGVNSITAVVCRDFLDRFGWKPKSEKAHLRFVRWLALGIGIVVVGLSSLMQYVPGNFVEVSRKTTGLLAMPMFMLFAMALFVPMSTTIGTILAAIYGFYASFVIAYWDVITAGPRLSFQWIVPVSLIVSLLVGLPASWIDRRCPRPLARLLAVLAVSLPPILLLLTWSRLT